MGSTIIRTALTKIVIYYAAFLILATALSFYSAGISRIVWHASVNRPYASILFQ